MIELCGKCRGPVIPETRICSRCGASKGPPESRELPILDTLAPIINEGMQRSILPPLCGFTPPSAPAEPAPLLPPLAPLKPITLAGVLPPIVLPPLEIAPHISAVGMIAPQEIAAARYGGAAADQYLGTEPVRVLVADPPWKFGDKLPGGGRGAEKHYGVLSIEEIKAFPLPPLADNCVLFLWRVEALGRLCYEVAEAWGFTPKSKITWRKTRPCKHCKGLGYMLHTVNDDDLQLWCEPCKGRGRNIVVGMGHYTRRATEDCLIAVRGSKPSLSHPKIHDQLDIFDAPRGEHSAKPDKFYEIVETLYPDGPYAELFARRRRERWQQFGDELPSIAGEIES